MTTTDTGIVLTGDAIDAFHLRTVMAALKIEIRTGMRHSSGISMVKVAQQTYGTTGRSKQGTLDQLQAIWDAKLAARENSR
jgi:hypothetical protein